MTRAPSSTIPTAGVSWTADDGAIRLGWVNVVVAAVVMLATLPGRTQGLGLITEPLLQDLQLDRITYANISLRATLLGAVICLPDERPAVSQWPFGKESRFSRLLTNRSFPWRTDAPWPSDGFSASPCS